MDAKTSLFVNIKLNELVLKNVFFYPFLSKHSISRILVLMSRIYLHSQRCELFDISNLLLLLESLEIYIKYGTRNVYKTRISIFFTQEVNTREHVG